MDELFLRDLNYGLYYSGAYEHENTYLTFYYNSESNNLILFDTSDCDEITVESICNATVSKGSYEYLIDVLNTNKNVLVYWSQVEGTTSDYIIYYDSDNEALIDEEIDISKALETINNDCIGYKFCEVRDKYQSKINF